MSIKLKPCPFCGYEEVTEDEGLYPSGKFFNIVCGQCMASVQGDAVDETISLWNTRPNDKLDRARDEIGRARAEIDKRIFFAGVDDLPAGMNHGLGYAIATIDKIKSED